MGSIQVLDAADMNIKVKVMAVSQIKKEMRVMPLHVTATTLINILNNCKLKVEQCV